MTDDTRESLEKTIQERFHAHYCGTPPSCGLSRGCEGLLPARDLAVVVDATTAHVAAVVAEKDAEIERLRDAYAEREQRWHWNLIREQNALRDRDKARTALGAVTALLTTRHNECRLCRLPVEPRCACWLAEARAVLAPVSGALAQAFVDVVFDGPPSAESGRFVETEDADGHGIRAGEWIDRGNGFWALRIPVSGAVDAERILTAEAAPFLGSLPSQIYDSVYLSRTDSIEACKAVTESIVRKITAALPSLTQRTSPVAKHEQEVRATLAEHWSCDYVVDGDYRTLFECGVSVPRPSSITDGLQRHIAMALTTRAAALTEGSE